MNGNEYVANLEWQVENQQRVIRGLKYDITRLREQLEAKRKSYDELQQYNVACIKNYGDILIEKTALKEQLEAAKADINAMVDETGNPCAYCKKNPCVPANDKCTGFVWRGEKEEKA